ncbi:MAG: hypothetical protein JXR60_07815 [Bacteroidales bacterium]|nr:hypothetical protein [Bacteroidales bacterium]
MKFLWTILLAIVVLQSCTEVKFKQPQPQGIAALESIPESMQGYYLLGDKDTVKIFANGFEMKKDSTNEKEQHELSEFFAIKRWKKTIFINLRDKDEPYWSVIFLTPNDSNISVGFLSFNQNDKESIDQFKQLTKVEELLNEEGKITNYLIDPSKKELKKILKTIPMYDLGKLRKIE